ncbi:MAG: hypothetical protein ACXVNQ_00825 [Bacteroidia bacterium]
MKKIPIFFLPFLLFSCSQAEMQKERPVSIQSWEVIGKDTCNRLDTKGQKQGMWLIFDNKRLQIKDTLYYKDGKIIDPKN